MKNRIVHDTIALTVITLASGLILGLVHDVTEEPIRVQQEKAKEEAYAAVFEEASGFESVITEEDPELEAVLDGEGLTGDSVDEIMKAQDDAGSDLGYVITVTSAEGYGGDIQFTMGVLSDGTINGVSILSISETAGLGMRADTDDFKGQFKGIKAEQIAYSKTGKSADNEIDALSGATVTTKAMTNGVNAGLLAYRYETEKEGE